MTIELTQEETSFLQSILINIVPNMQVPAKDAAPILQMCQAIAAKLQQEPSVKAKAKKGE